MSEGRTRIAITVIFVAVFSYLLYFLRSVTIPILIATVIAYILDPVIDKLEGLNIGRSTSILLLTLFSVLVISLAILLAIPAIEGELKTAANNLPQYFDSFKKDALPLLEKGFGSLFPQIPFTVEGILKEGEVLVKNVPVDLWGNIMKKAASTLTGTLSFAISIIGVLIIPVYIYYILKDFDAFKDGVVSFIPERNRAFLIDRFSEVDEVLSSFARGQAMICLMLAILYSIGLYLIGIDLALVIGLFSGAAFIIPYAGTILGIAAASAMALLQFHDIIHIIYIFILYGTVQLLEGFVITPKVIGEKLGLHPLAIILAIIIGGEIFGFLGILLAVPAAATIKIFAVAALEDYKDSDYYKAAMP